MSISSNFLLLVACSEVNPELQPACHKLCRRGVFDWLLRALSGVYYVTTALWPPSARPSSWICTGVSRSFRTKSSRCILQLLRRQTTEVWTSSSWRAARLHY